MLNILQLCHKSPYPPHEGSAIAASAISHGLADLGHRVKVLAMNIPVQWCDPQDVPANLKARFRFELVEVDTSLTVAGAVKAAATNASYHLSRFTSAEFGSRLENILRDEAFDLVVFDSLYTAAYINTVRRLSDARILLRTHNVEHDIWERVAGKTGNLVKSRYLRYLAKQLQREEIRHLSAADAVATISNEDRQRFEALGVTTKMAYVPVGLDLSSERFLRQSDVQSQISKMPALFFLGNMNWEPNRQAVRWFLDSVWPLVSNAHRTVTLHLAGPGMPEDIRRQHGRRIEVTPRHVDPDEFMRDKPIMVVPSLTGSGVRVKVIEGLALGKIVITNPNGANGIDYTNGQELLVAEGEQAFAQVIGKCLTNPEQLEHMPAAARTLATNSFSHVSAAISALELIGLA